MRQLRKLIILAILILVLMGCIKEGGWQKSFDNSSNVGWHKTTLDSSNTQNPTEKIAVLKEIMRVEPLSKIFYVQYIEYQMGDNFLGPSDYRFYAKFVVEQRDIIK
jgi:hypothetical protein